nr:MAG TPA: 43 kDa tail protein [Caudoviricetes sp.]
MTGYLTTIQDQVWRLPVLTAWEILRTDGESCDSFFVRFAFEAAQLTTLRQAVRFRAEEAGETVFTGIVDEFEITASDGGLVAELTGRSLGGLLLDNETRAATYLTATLSDILKQYVYPLGITRVDADQMISLHNFAVDSGDTCQTALAGFCRHAAGVTPRFLADGTLQLRKSPAVSRRKITAATEVTEAVVRMCRYGVISEQVLVHSRTGAVEAVQNEDFVALGGRARKVTLTSGDTTRAQFRTAAQRIAASNRELWTLEVTLPGAFLAEPQDTVAVTLPHLGVDQTLAVQQVCSRADQDGVRCTLTLGQAL